MKMKKLVTTIAVGAMMLAGAGQASAFFEDLQLIRSIYDTQGTTEIASNLGTQAFTSAGGYGTNVNVGDLVSLSSFAHGADALKIGYFAADDSAGIATADYWTSGQLATATSIYGGRGTTLQSKTTGIQGYYASFNASTVTVNTGDVNSYKNQMEIPAGSFGNTTTAPGQTTISLADLLVNGYVDQGLYYFDYDNLSNRTAPKAGVLVATIRTTLDANGNIGTTINPVINPVPVPPSVLLLGTGLLGLVGIRRKK